MEVTCSGDVATPETLKGCNFIEIIIKWKRSGVEEIKKKASF